MLIGLKQIGASEAQQVLHTTTGMKRKFLKNDLVNQIFRHVLVGIELSGCSQKGVHYVQKMLESQTSKSYNGSGSDAVPSISGEAVLP